MSARDIVGGLAGAAVGAMKHPIGTAGGALNLARTAVGTGTAVGTAVAGTVARRVRGAGEVKAQAADAARENAGSTVDDVQEAAQDAAGAAEGTAAKVAGAAKRTAEGARNSTARASGTAKAAKAPAKKAAAKKAPKKGAVKREPQIVLAEPAPPLEPPIDVVGQALAAEERDTIGAGRMTEPRGASRDEEHGDAALQRAEVEEIAEEMVEMTEAGNVGIATPVGTTGADVGFNPDTAEADLQQPGTQPLLDPSLTKAIKAEQDTLHHAADLDKG